MTAQPSRSPATSARVGNPAGFAWSSRSTPPSANGSTNCSAFANGPWMPRPAASTTNASDATSDAGTPSRTRAIPWISQADARFATRRPVWMPRAVSPNTAMTIA